MRTLATLPKPVLILEAIGGIILILSILVLNGWLSLTASFSSKTQAAALLTTGVLLMLPAAWLMMWRTAKAMAPQLFGNANKKDNLHIAGDSHDADHRFTAQPPLDSFFY